MQIYQKNLIAICENINGDYNLVSIDYGPKFYIFYGDICHSPCRCLKYYTWFKPTVLGNISSDVVKEFGHTVKENKIKKFLDSVTRTL